MVSLSFGEIRLDFLTPAIVERIVGGRQPPELTAHFNSTRPRGDSEIPEVHSLAARWREPTVSSGKARERDCLIDFVTDGSNSAACTQRDRRPLQILMVDAKKAVQYFKYRFLRIGGALSYSGELIQIAALGKQDNDGVDEGEAGRRLMRLGIAVSEDKGSVVGRSLELEKVFRGTQWEKNWHDSLNGCEAQRATYTRSSRPGVRSAAYGYPAPLVQHLSTRFGRVNVALV